jgi:hypothetical protein
MLFPHLSRCVLAAAALALWACHPGGKVERTLAASPEAPAVDAGAPVLAAVQNARAAIAAGDPVAAFNDVNLGLGYAVQLVGADSALYPAGAAPPGYRAPSGGGGQQGTGGAGSGGHRHGGARHAAGGQASTTSAPPPAASVPPPVSPHGHHGGGGAPTPVTSFDVQVKLISAQAKLQARDMAGADADLQVIEAAASAQAAPPSLPLIRAGESLTLAASAVSGGRLAQLRTQLVAAQASLAAYHGAPHAAEASAVAAAIGQALRQPGGVAALPPAQVALWSGVVGTWT